MVFSQRPLLSRARTLAIASDHPCSLETGADEMLVPSLTGTSASLQPLGLIFRVAHMPFVVRLGERLGCELLPVATLFGVVAGIDEKYVLGPRNSKPEEGMRRWM